MNNKRKNFLISYSILIAFIIIIVLVSNYYLVSYIGFNQDTFLFITIFLIFIGVLLNYILGKPLLEPLFKSDENLKKSVKETLHEINIPTATIKANIQMLEKNIQNEKDKKRVGRIKKACDELIKLYDEMEYQIKKEINSVDLQEFSLKTCIDESIEKFCDIKEDIKIDVNVHDVMLKTDKNGFQKVIDNLLSNAVKYNKPNGYVEIFFSDSILTIYNTGNTIDTKNLFIVFEQYFQEDESKKGFGLGLNIVKSFCDEYKIDIKIEPKDDGTEVRLDIKSIIKNIIDSRY